MTEHFNPFKLPLRFPTAALPPFYYRIPPIFDPDPTSTPFNFGNTLQNLNVSSAAPVTMVSASGDMARYRTRLEWPVNVFIFFIEGYFQRIMALSW